MNKLFFLLFLVNMSYCQNIDNLKIRDTIYLDFRNKCRMVKFSIRENKSPFTQYYEIYYKKNEIIYFLSQHNKFQKKMKYKMSNLKKHKTILDCKTISKSNYQKLLNIFFSKKPVFYYLEKISNDSVEAKSIYLVNEQKSKM